VAKFRVLRLNGCKCFCLQLKNLAAEEKVLIFTLIFCFKCNVIFLSKYIKKCHLTKGANFVFSGPCLWPFWPREKLKDRNSVNV